jgi:hypothetical protein
MNMSRLLPARIGQKARRPTLTTEGAEDTEEKPKEGQTGGNNRLGAEVGTDNALGLRSGNSGDRKSGGFL